MAPGWDEHKAELEHLYLTRQPTKTLKEIIDFMKFTHGFHRSEKSYERQFKTWGFRKNMKSSDLTALNRVVRKRNLAGKKSRVILHGNVFDIDDPCNKRKMTRNDSSIGLESELAEISYIYTPHADSFPQEDLLKDLPWYRFQGLLPPDAKKYPDLAVIASQMAIQSKCLASTSSSTGKARPALNLAPLESVLACLSLHVKVNCRSLEQHTRKCHRYLEAVFVPEVQDASSTNNESNSGAVLLMNNRDTPYFSLLVYLASNNLLQDAAVDSMLDYAENLIRQRQFKAVFSTTEATIRALLDRLLASAVKEKNVLVVKAALSAGACPNVLLGFSGESVLMWASRHGSIAIMELLLDAGAESQSSHLTGRTALGHATEHGGGVDAVKLLLKSGVTSKNDAEAALSFAIQKSRTDICGLILNAYTGIDLNRTAALTRCGCSFLEDAVKAGCLELVKMLINRGADVNIPPPSGRQTLLQSAVRSGNIEIIKCLLHLGADVNQEAHGGTAIQLACQKANKELIVLLLEAGAKINAAPYHDGGRTALQYAAESADMEVIQLLLQRGADVNGPAAAKRGRTAVQAAFEANDIGIVKLLLAHSAEVNTSAALREATRNGNIAMIQLLLEMGADILAPPGDGGKSIMESAIAYEELDLESELLDTENKDDYYEADEAAIRFRKVEHAWHQRDFPFIHRVLELSKSLDVASLCGRNTLPMAASRYHDTNIDLVTFLLENGITPDARNDDNSPTALHIAILHHDFPVIQALLKAGADFHLLWGYESVIEVALSKAFPGEFRFLPTGRILFNAWKLFQNPNDFAHDSSGNFVEYEGLQFALSHPTILGGSKQFLRSMGVLIIKENMERVEQRVVDAIAVATGQWRQEKAEILQMLLDAGFDPNFRHEQSPTPLQLAAHLADASLVQSLLSAKADVNAPAQQVSFTHGDGFEKEAWTALQASITTVYHTPCNLKTVHLLLHHGANINAPAPPGRGTRTALQASIEVGNMELTQLLLKRGADVKAPAGPHCGVTALQAAAMKGYVGLAVQLLEAGADVNAPRSPRGGRTALEGAAEMGRLDMVQLLLNHGAGYVYHEDGIPDYERALKFAKREGHFVVHDLIRDYFDNDSKPHGSGEAEGASNMEHNPTISEWDPSNSGWDRTDSENMPGWIPWDESQTAWDTGMILEEWDT